ncbi:uncharacterized protein A1O9_09609, partial [Exophiala aquamarina CBS 119918]
LGTKAYRHTRQLSTRLGRPLRVAQSNIQGVLRAPQEVRLQPITAQLKIHNISLSVRQFQRKLKEHLKQ